MNASQPRRSDGTPSPSRPAATSGGWMRGGTAAVVDPLSGSARAVLPVLPAPDAASARVFGRRNQTLLAVRSYVTPHEAASLAVEGRPLPLVAPTPGIAIARAGCR